RGGGVRRRPPRPLINPPTPLPHQPLLDGAGGMGRRSFPNGRRLRWCFCLRGSSGTSHVAALISLSLFRASLSDPLVTCSTGRTPAVGLRQTA
ncbi:hypothetical protein KUCAC02_000051, partial [Chaenocephalus aceratus]